MDAHRDLATIGNENLLEHFKPWAGIALRTLAKQPILLEVPVRAGTSSVVWLRMASSRFRDKEHRQDQQLWLDRMPVAGVREYEIVGGRIGQNESREKPCSAPLLTQCAEQTRQAQHRRCQEE